MADKKVYFFKVDLFDKDGGEKSHRELPELLKEIIEKSAMDHGSYVSLDLTVDDEYTHIVWDIFNYQDTRLFGRLSRQQPSNTFLTREYSTLEKEDVQIPDETRAGIEKYTYGSLDYETGIFSIIGALGAPAEKVIANAFWKYNKNYYITMTPIPNANAIDMIYRGEQAQVTQLELEVPLPEAGTLAEILKWSEAEVLDSLENKNLKLELVVKPQWRRGCVTRDSEETVSFLNRLVGHKRQYQKAKVKAKTKTLKLREYDLFEQNFSYLVNIATYRTIGGKRVNYKVDELVDIYRNAIVGSFEKHRRLLATIVGR